METDEQMARRRAREDEYAKCLRLLCDIFSPETDAILNAYVGRQTRDGWAEPLPVTTDADAIAYLMGTETY